MSSPAFERILYRADGAVARVTLNRPEKRNALDAETIGELALAFGRAEADAAVRVVLLRGAGQHFCAGADLPALQSLVERGDPVENLHDAAALGQLFISMRQCRCIIVAAVHGNAIAGGAGLATACDIILAAEDAVFGYPEVNIGFVPAMVMGLLRRTLGEKLAFELVARGERISAADAARIGLVNRVIPSDHFDADVEKWLLGLAARSGSALQLTKRLFYGIDMLPVEQAIGRGAEVNALARFTHDCRDGVRRFLDREG
jgi:methylglutaconyl-CoA hydratase